MSKKKPVDCIAEAFARWFSGETFPKDAQQYFMLEAWQAAIAWSTKRERVTEEKPSRESAHPVGLSDAPCDKCGYNGRGYYQLETHPCAGTPKRESVIDMDWEPHFFAEIKDGNLVQYSNAIVFEINRIEGGK